MFLSHILYILVVCFVLVSLSKKKGERERGGVSLSNNFVRFHHVPPLSLSLHFVCLPIPAERLISGELSISHEILVGCFCSFHSTRPCSSFRRAHVCVWCAMYKSCGDYKSVGCLMVSVIGLCFFLFCTYNSYYVNVYAGVKTLSLSPSVINKCMNWGLVGGYHHKACHRQTSI